MPNLETRTITTEFRVSDDTSPKIEGYAAKFGIRSEDFGGWVEVLAPTCFDAAMLTNPDVRGLFNHDANLILGRTLANTLTLSKDDVGLAYMIDPPDTQYARDLITSMKRGDVTQSSFAFIANDTVWNYDEATGLDVRTVLQAQLFDVSPVTFPAYTDTTSGVRSLPLDMPQEIRSRIQTRHNMPVETPAQDIEVVDETELHKLSIRLKLADLNARFSHK